MAEWRVGRKLGVTLYRDEVFVGHVSTPEIALEIVGAMRAVARLLGDEPRACGCDPAAGVECRQHMTMITDGSRRESGRERSPESSPPRVVRPADDPGDAPGEWEHWHSSAGLVE